MYREMRLKARKIDDNEALEIVKSALYGVLSTVDENGCPYGVPVSCAYLDGSLYFHCAREGHKLDNIKNNNKVSFCAVGKAVNSPEQFTVRYESAIVFGSAQEVTGEEKLSAFRAIVEKYSPEFMEEGNKKIDKAIDRTTIIRITIEHISGKASRA